MANPNSYQPPYTINPAIVNLVAEIGQAVGRLTVLTDETKALQLRRVNRIRTIRGSLAIEGNTLSDALRDAIREAIGTDQASDQVRRLIAAIGTGELGSNNLMKTLGLSHRPTFRGNYLNPAMEGGWIERTQPDSPRSPTQRYRLTDKGRQWLR